MGRSLAAAVIAFVILAGPAAARPLSITVVNQPIHAQAIVENGHVLLPLRATFEALNSRVSYDSEHGVITARNILHRVRLRLGSKDAVIDGRLVTLEAPARRVNGRVYVPLRFAAAAMGAIVQYDPKAQTVAVNGSPRTASQRVDVAHPPRELNPPPEASITTAYPVISASLGGAIAASNAVRLTVDGSDVTAQAAFDGRTITYVPQIGLPQGGHTAVFSGHTANGHPFSTQWNFETSTPQMDADSAYAFGDYRFYGGLVYSYAGGSVMNFTLIGPPTGSGFVQICGPQFVYPLWNAGGQWYRARIVLPRPYIVGSCPITAIYIGRNGHRRYIPITPMGSSNGLFITGNPLNPLGQYPSAPIYVPVLPQHP